MDNLNRSNTEKMKGKIHEHPKANTNGFDKNPQNIGNRKPSLKKQLEKIALADGWLEFDKSDVEILDNVVRIKVPKEEQIALKVFDIAMGKNPTAAINAIKLYLETFDGKAKQEVQVENKVIKVTLTD